MIRKVCSKCKIEKDLSEFRKNKNNKDGHEFACATCRSKACVSWYWERGGKEHSSLHRKNTKKERRKWEEEWRKTHRSDIRKNTFKYLSTHPKETIFKSARGRATQSGIEFSIDLSDVVIPENCPVFNVPFCFERGLGEKNKIRTNNPSLDRIDPKKGYIKGNVWVISTLANLMKNKATKEQLKTFCENMLKIINEGNTF